MSTANPPSVTHPLAHLPFVKVNAAGVDLWDVPPIDDWAAATRLGRDYADRLLLESDNALAVYWVIRAIMDRRVIGGVETGFLQSLAAYAINGRS